MNQVTLLRMMGFLLMSFLLMQEVIAEPVYYKWDGNPIAIRSKNVIKTEVVDVGYDDYSTISLFFNYDGADYDIIIYNENGEVIVSDSDEGKYGTSINYTITDVEQGVYTVFIQTKDGSQFVGKFNMK